jgi:hypothetical protein
MKMPFGKYKGTDITQLSDGYIFTLLEYQRKTLPKDLRKALEEEMSDRELSEQYAWESLLGDDDRY